MVESLKKRKPAGQEERAVIVFPETGQLVAIPDSQKIMIIAAPGLVAAGASLLYPKAVAGLLERNPGAVKQMLDAARVFPGLFLDRKEQPSTRLEDIRRNYPDIIAFLTEKKTKELLNQHPLVQARVDEDRELLSGVSGGHQIQTSELLLRTLVANTTIRDLSPQTFSGIIASHRLYVSCLELFEIRENYPQVSGDLDKFIAAGQRLGALVRLMDPSFPEEIKQTGEYSARKIKQEGNQGPNLPETAMIQRESEARKAQRSALQNLIGMCGDEPVARSLRERLEFLGETEPVTKALKSLEEPGQPDFSKAEIVHHHGYE